MTRSALIAGAMLCLLSGSDALAFSGNAVTIFDGDTIEVLNNDGGAPVRVRLASIDAPEKDQPFGTAARTALANLVHGQQVDVQDDGKDRYKRTIGLVTVNGLNVNAEMVRRGLAWAYVDNKTHYVNMDRDSDFICLQNAAAKAHTGLFSESNPTKPWLWRKGEKN